MIFTRATGGSHDHSCVMMYLPAKVGKEILDWGNKNIDEDWLAADGRETEPHVTLLYGLTATDKAEVEPYFPKGPVKAQLGEINRFDSSEEFDVMKIEVHSDELAKYHKEMKANCENVDSHDTYQAHITLAYVSKGKGTQFDGDRTFDGLDLELSDLVWSAAGKGEDRKEHINLGKISKAWLWQPTFKDKLGGF